MKKKTINKKVLNILYSSIEKTKILKREERFLAAISGGKDSIFMLDLLFLYSKELRMEWEIIPVYLHLLHYKENIKEKMKNLLQKYTYNFVIEEIDLEKNLRKKDSICYTCSRIRKMKLFDIAKKQNVKKIALAHNADDVVETYLMNIIFSGETSTLMPVQDFFNGKFIIIRPIYTINSKLINKYIKENDLNIVVKKQCIYTSSNKREKIREFLLSMENEEVIRKNIYRAINNINKNYIPDLKK